MSTFFTRAIELTGKILLLLGALISIGGVVWLRNFVLSGWAFKWSSILIVAGVSIMALGGGLQKLARSRESAGGINSQTGSEGP